MVLSVQRVRPFDVFIEQSETERRLSDIYKEIYHVREKIQSESDLSTSTFPTNHNIKTNLR